MNENPTKPATRSSRDVETLIALLRYEMSNEHGCSSGEILEEMFDYVKGVVLNSGIPPEPTDEDLAKLDLAKMHRTNVAFAEHLLRALIAAGHGDDAQRFVEDTAGSRRQCEARFGTTRAIPFSDEEREELSKAWGGGSLASTEAH